MKKKYRFFVVVLLVLGVLLAAILFLHTRNIAVLNPKGLIAQKERNLMVIAVLLSAIVVIPVFIMTATIVWKYREGNTKARYTPEWDHSRVAETIWWIVPLILISILSVITWQSSHQLDPFKPLASSTKAMTIQVVALDWKWLFIYPEQNIATVNFVQFAENTPINFEITADAPMNSFWIPQLGGQIYAMSGMSTQLHLMANQPGNYNGSSANISGRGFAGMKFVAKVSSATDFNQWAESVKHSPNNLNLDTYNVLAKPSENNPISYYSSATTGLYNEVVMKYMSPADQMSAMAHNHVAGGQ